MAATPQGASAIHENGSLMRTEEEEVRARRSRYACSHVEYVYFGYQIILFLGIMSCRMCVCVQTSV